MKNILSALIIGSMLLTATGCSETENIVPRVGEIRSDRVVLIEDFTGVQCVNCPNASREITSLIGRYPDNVVAVAYHTDFLGAPITKDGYESKYDFRTPEGNELESNYLNTPQGPYLGKPAVGLNRKIFNPLEEFILTGTSIFGNIENELRTIPKAKINIINTYDEASRKLSVIIEVDPQSANNGDYRLHALITESHIIDSQEDNKIFVKDYDHKHVFRKMLSSLAGDAIGGTLTPGTKIVRNFEFTLPPEAGWWVAENCSVVAFISDLSVKTFSVGAVLQAAEAHVTE